MLLWLLSVTISSTQAPGPPGKTRQRTATSVTNIGLSNLRQLPPAKLIPAARQWSRLRPRRRLAIVRPAPHPELRVSPMNAIERKFSLARCRFTLDDDTPASATPKCRQQFGINDVRFCADNGLKSDIPRCPKSARSGLI